MKPLTSSWIAARQQYCYPTQSCESHLSCLLPTFRLPTLIHSRSGNAKWLAEIANRNPVWIHTSDARKLGVEAGGLVRVTTEIGYFVDRVWITEGIKQETASAGAKRCPVATSDGTRKGGQDCFLSPRFEFVRGS